MNLQKYVVLQKPRGITPLEAIETWKIEHLEYADVPASYAGRLDPMATGRLLVLLGDECKRKEQYNGLDKEYIVEIVFDLLTDSSDELGIVQYAGIETHPDAHEISHALRSLRGAHVVPYPSFSSKTVNGKPLFLYTLEGTLDTIVIPEHTETIYKTEVLSVEQISSGALAKRIEKDLEVVPTSDSPSKRLGNDFRQDVVRNTWHELFENMDERTFTVVRLRVTCASGTYMRSLAERLANKLGTTGIALSIDRSKIGKYVSFGSFGFWLKKY